MTDYKTADAEAAFEEERRIYLAESQAILISKGYSRSAARAKAIDQLEAAEDGDRDVTGARSTLLEAQELKSPTDPKGLAQVRAIQRDLLRRLD